MIALGFVQHLKYVSPFQGFYTTGVLPMAYVNGLQPATPFGVKVSAIG